MIEATDAKLLEQGEECTLLDWGNAIIVSIDHNLRLIHARLNLAGDVKTTKRKVSIEEGKRGKGVFSLG